MGFFLESRYVGPMQPHGLAGSDIKESRFGVIVKHHAAMPFSPMADGRSRLRIVFHVPILT
jgi:hypothetical protein